MEKLINCTFILLCAFSLGACGKYSDGDFRVYTIKKGNHYCAHGIKVLLKNSLHFKFKFDESAKYELDSEVSQLSLNKLYGMSDNDVNHHKNSARIGWRWMNDSIQLFAYVYSSRDRVIKYLTSVLPNEEHECHIYCFGRSYQFLLDNKWVEVLRDTTNLNSLSYVLFPYFGGVQTAPHNIRVKISQIR